MSYSVPPPAAMAAFPVYAYEWIDNLHFVRPPGRLLPDPAAHVEAARAAFLAAGWEGEGDIGLL